VKRQTTSRGIFLINATSDRLEKVVEVGGCFGDFEGYEDKECKDCAFWSGDLIVQCALPIHNNETLVDTAKEMLYKLEGVNK
jgi:hypothetical protein